MKYLKNLILEGECLNILLIFKDFEFVEHIKAFQNLFYFAKMNPVDINENKTNRLEWKKARNYWTNIFPYIKEYNPVGPKPEQIKNIYKLNKIKENLESCLQKRDEIKAYSQTLIMLIDLILHIIKVRHDDIIERICKVAIYKDKREKIIKENADIDEERQKIIDAAKALNPNVRLPGEKEKEKENEENKEEEKKVEENKEEEKKEEEKKEEENKSKENKEEGEVKKEENEENKEEEKKEELNQDEIDSAKLADDLKKFDEEHPKQEVPPDMEYDIDNDYDIDQAEKDTEINNALQASLNSMEKEKEKNKPNMGLNTANNNAQPTGNQNNENNQGK